MNEGPIVWMKWLWCECESNLTFEWTPCKTKLDPWMNQSPLITLIIWMKWTKVHGWIKNWWTTMHYEVQWNNEAQWTKRLRTNAIINHEPMTKYPWTWKHQRPRINGLGMANYNAHVDAWTKPWIRWNPKHVDNVG